MSSTFDKIDFDIILKRLIETRDWLSSIQLNPNESRFSDILEHVNLICDYLGKNKAQDLVDHFDNEILWYALLESRAFLDIHKPLTN